MIESQSSRLICTRCVVPIAKPRPAGSCCQARLLTVVNKDSFEAWFVCLQQEEFVLSCLLKPPKKCSHMDSQMGLKKCTVLLVHFAARIGAKLATFAAGNSTANVSYAKFQGCAAALSLSTISVVSPWHFQMLFPSPSAGAVR